jgi:hypothetical protein
VVLIKIRLTFYDKLFIAFVLAVSVGVFLLNLRLDAAAEQKYLTVHVNNELVMEFSFNNKTERQISFSFGEKKEHLAVLEISGGRVRMLPLSRELCPRGICSHTGWISRNYQSIVCVPNRIIVAFSDKKLDGVDGVTY